MVPPAGRPKKEETLTSFSIRLSAEAIEAIKHYSLTPEIRAHILNLIRMRQQMGENDAMSVDEMVGNLVAAGGEACEDSLAEAVVAYRRANKPERDEVRTYSHVGVTFLLVSPPKGWCRFHGKPAGSEFIIVRSDDQFESDAVVWFASTAQAHFENEAWIG